MTAADTSSTAIVAAVNEVIAEHRRKGYVEFSRSGHIVERRQIVRVRLIPPLIVFPHSGSVGFSTVPSLGMPCRHRRRIGIVRRNSGRGTLSQIEEEMSMVAADIRTELGR